MSFELLSFRPVTTLCKTLVHIKDPASSEQRTAVVYMYMYRIPYSDCPRVYIIPDQMKP